MSTSSASALVRLISSLMAVAAAFAVALIIIVFAGYSATDTIEAFWQGAFGSTRALTWTLDRMIPLILVAYGFTLVAHTKQLSIGFEGQILAGGVAASVFAFIFDGLPGPIHLLLAVLGGVLGGAMWASIAATLFVYRGVMIILSTFMLNLIAVQVVDYLLRGPLQEPTGMLVQSKAIPASATWPAIGSSGLTWDILYVPAATLILLAVMHRTTIGMRLRILSANPNLARHIGLRAVPITARTLIVSGAMAGLAGSSLILGSQTATVQNGFSSNYGFDGIAVALLAQHSPIGSLLSALLFAAMRQSAGLMQVSAGVPSGLIQAAQGMVIVFVVATSLLLQPALLSSGAASLKNLFKKGLRWGRSTSAC